MKLIVTPIHTIPLNSISTISFAADDNNPNLCALTFFLQNNSSLIPIYASKQQLVRLLKQRIEKFFISEDKIFDMEKEITDMDNELKEFYNNKPVFYSFISEQDLMTEMSRYRQ